MQPVTSSIGELKRAPQNITKEGKEKNSSWNAKKQVKTIL